MEQISPAIKNDKQTRVALDSVINSISSVILGKERETKLAISCLLAKGHLLIEDIPGIGKTTLAKAMAKVLGLKFRRVQCTSDMLPVDILGVAVFEQSSGSFIFHEGPIFTQVLLTDEINRTTPKTQSALLEAMEELQVTTEGETRKLDSPFFVVATQNPLEQAGTFPLPESQLDRFLIRISLGYPNREAEQNILRHGGAAESIEELKALVSPEDVILFQAEANETFASDSLLDYIQDILEFTRISSYFHLGLSPRAGISLLRASRAWAYVAGRKHVLPEDVQEILPFVVRHRLRARKDFQEFSAEELQEMISEVAVPN